MDKNDVGNSMYISTHPRPDALDPFLFNESGPEILSSRLAAFSTTAHLDSNRSNAVITAALWECFFAPGNFNDIHISCFGARKEFSSVLEGGLGIRADGTHPLSLRECASTSSNLDVSRAFCDEVPVIG